MKENENGSSTTAEFNRAAGKIDGAARRMVSQINLTRTGDVMVNTLSYNEWVRFYSD